ncbi:MAG TPA: quinone-dependent dihydroorotate dehydrogenase [Xanthomonadaceae bacterium]|jgi:dihydroorotate dehydrogenase|nr:quinone-dependent dihydroorotate dehydrogenase [Xanthomonadaceae bacterium]
MYGLVRPFLFALDPETAHGLGMKAIEAAYRSGANPLLSRKPPRLPTRVFWRLFENPFGLAAGLDKNGAHVDALLSLGFGFIEVGTTTPRPQPGNPKPRMFRLPEHQAIINRLGFNNDGVDALVKNVSRARRKGIVGINIGKNADTPIENAVDDYLHCLERVYPIADYVTVNISSPNTVGLRDLQRDDALRALVGALRESQEKLRSQHRKDTPMLLKIAPDLEDAEIDGLARVMIEAGVEGIIATNTTIARTAIQGHKYENEAGGLSGKPLYARSTAVLSRLRARVGEKIPLIGVGGIMSGGDAVAKVAAGATLVQCYTGLIYRGPNLISECVSALRARREGSV